MIKSINVAIVFSSDKVSTELVFIIGTKQCTQLAERPVLYQFTDLQSGFIDGSLQIQCHSPGFHGKALLTDFMALLRNAHIVEFAENAIPAQPALIDLRHILLTQFLIRKVIYTHCHMTFSLVMRRHISPLITVMPDQIITAFIGDHRLLSLKIPLLDREHHIFVKKKRTAAPAHGITVTFLFFIREHDLLKLCQCSFFTKKNIRKKILQIHGCRYLPAVAVAYRNIDKI